MSQLADNWCSLPLRERINRVCALRHALAADPQRFIDAIHLPFRRSPVETLGSEIIPLADACAFLERHAERLLRPRRLGPRSRLLWPWSVRTEIHRQPLGTVLIIGPANYPLFLPGVQIVQALVAGNRVLFKPAPGTSAIATLLTQTLHAAGVPPQVLALLDESPDAARAVYGQVDKVILTGSHATGRAIARDLADHLKPATMELSGCDAAIVLPDADLKLTADCLRFGLSFNGSNSCIAPRRLLVDAAMADILIQNLRTALATVSPLALTTAQRAHLGELIADAIQGGAKLVLGDWPIEGDLKPLILDHAAPDMRLHREDVGLPVASIIRIHHTDEIHAANAHCPFKLGASIFGSPSSAEKIARQLDVGSIVINDLIAPTADPRLPFGGGGASGFGTTRGAEGLLEMTRPKTIQFAQRSPHFHLLRETPATAELLRAQLAFQHARMRGGRLAGLRKMIAAGRIAAQHQSNGTSA